MLLLSVKVLAAQYKMAFSTGLSKLLELDLSRNYLTNSAIGGQNIETPFRTLSSLQQLNVSQNALSVIHFQRRHLQLKILDFSHNILEILEDDSFTNAPSLQ